MPKPIIQGPYRTFRRLSEHETFLEFEGSTITIALKARKSAKSPWLHEEIKLRAYMRLEIFPAYINNLGTREFQFIIRDWWLNGKSEMLSDLFFDDPRGFWLGKVEKGEFRDYVPATVTFRVSNNYEIDVDGPAGFSACDIFGAVKDLEIRNLTSHDLRTWEPIEERGETPSYSLPGNRIYWLILPAGSAHKYEIANIVEDVDAPVILFHKKPPTARNRFDPRADGDRADYLLAVGSLAGGKDRGEARASFVASVPDSRGGLRLEALKVQQSGNVVLSPLYRPRRNLEIRGRLAPELDMGKFAEHLNKTGGVSGSIRIVSPARSLGTADQGPLPGEPIDSVDFPARITYAINYNIKVNREQFVEDQAGIAIAVGVDDVPPRDVTVAFDKPHIGHVLQKYLEFGPGHCTGMHEITQQDYDHGVNFCRYWRTVPLSPDPKDWVGFRDFDPGVDY